MVVTDLELEDYNELGFKLFVVKNYGNISKLSNIYGNKIYMNNQSLLRSNNKIMGVTKNGINDNWLRPYIQNKQTKYKLLGLPFNIYEELGKFGLKWYEVKENSEEDLSRGLIQANIFDFATTIFSSQAEKLYLATSDREALNNIETTNITHLVDIISAEHFSSPNIQFMSKWDTSKVKSISKLFLFKSNLIKDIAPLAYWDVSNVEDMSSAFEGFKISDFTPLKNWNTISLKNMKCTFCMSEIKNLDFLSNWNTQQLEYLDEAFAYCSTLKDITGIFNWEMPKLKRLNEIFHGESWKGVSRNKKVINSFNSIKNRKLMLAVDRYQTRRYDDYD